MNPVKKFVYISLQIILGFTLFAFAAIISRDTYSYDNFADRLGKWFDWFLKEEIEK